MTQSENPGRLPFTLQATVQVTLGALAMACGAFLGWSQISPVDGAMLLISGVFFAGIGGYRLLRRRG